MRKAAPVRTRGFTLVELLVVIAIIALLIGILVPTVAAVRRAAKNSASHVALQALSTGLEMFKGDDRIGGAYPPSSSDQYMTFGGENVGKAKSPYTNSDIAISGAGLLLWALSGADQLGSPGFKAFGARTSWSASTGTSFSDSDAYAMYPTGTSDPRAGQVLHARAAQYIEAGRVKITVDEDTAPGTVNFRVPSEQLQSGWTRQYPMYLDGFGYPILYWRADAAGRKIADRDLYGTTAAADRGIYHWSDNAALVKNLGGNPPPDPWLDLSGSGQPHRLDWQNIATNPPVALPTDTFASFIQNQTVQAKYQPYRADSYILLSPGADGLYGTADDVTNFGGK